MLDCTDDELVHLGLGVAASELTYEDIVSFLMFKAMRILVLKFLKFQKPKAWRLMSLMSLLVASNLALE